MFANEFIFLGLSRNWSTQHWLFVLFLAMYIITLAGNALIITVIWLDPRLDTPMYFFLGNLSFLNICYTTSVVPQMLIHFLAQHKVISFSRCTAQLFVSLSLGGIEFILLATMAYDRYVAICNPLHYTAIMSKRVCIQLAASSWAVGFLSSLVQTAFTMHLRFCGLPALNHFVCELLAVVKVACSDTYINEAVIVVAGVVVLLVPCFMVLVSYIYIISSILRIHSSRGRYKAFSTCASHLTVVTLCYGTAIFAYMRLKGGHLSANLDKMISLFYAIITPMLNPIIYSLRNQEVKGALVKTIGKLTSLRQ
ncbi:olfactory receptor 2F1-like [Alligator sinensis]|uniref:Olfactory receptor n=1 Tax=Alligator sinensis TaxID=38654 RepID=A0A3Q0HJF0_ALLSI|nr:olfactory receptor 2F1-like [Alligator sinensis]